MARLETYNSRPTARAGSQELVSSAFRTALEDAVEKRGKSESADRMLEHIEDLTGQEIESKEDLHELDKTVQEDLQFGNNSALYTTAITDFIEQEFEPSLVAIDAINRLTLQNGQDSIKVPKQPDLQVASTVANDGTLTDDSTDYDQKTIQTAFVGLTSLMTSELLENANIDLMEDQLRQIANAVERKVDADIIAEINKASTKNDGEYGTNNNFRYLGTGEDITYDDVIEAYFSAVSNNAEPDMLLMNPDVAGNLHTDADTKDAVAFGTVNVGDGNQVADQVQQFLGFPVMISSQVGAERAYWIDTDRLGYLVEQTGIQTMDQQVDGKAAFEVKAIKGFGVGITKPQAVYSIIEQTDEPA